VQKKVDLTIGLFIKITVQVVCGPFTFSEYPIPVIATALGIILFTFFISLQRQEYFSFLLQLLICNHFLFGYENGGVFNFAASISLIIYLFISKNQTFVNTSLSKGCLISILLLGIIQGLSLFNSDSALNLKLIAAFFFFNLLFLFYYSSKIALSSKNFVNIFQVLGLFFIYMFIVSLNQKFIFFQSNYAFFPNLDPDAEYELGITRSAGTLGNFEAYAEYSVSMAALCLPGILSGSYFKANRPFYYFCCLIVLLSILSIVLSGTRSSILLLPFLIITICIILGRQLKIKTILVSAFLITAFVIINNDQDFFDLNVFSQRSESVDFQKLTLSKLLSGEEMNRGNIFAYAFKKIDRVSGLVGEGYFTNRSEYTKVHFDQGKDVSIPDYHNLYLSSIVIWGYVGTIIFISIFISTIIRGFKLYYKLRSNHFYLVDLLLGFNLLFTFFMINQFKIQFIRDANYFVLIFLLLAVYNSLMKYLSNLSNSYWMLVSTTI